MFNMYSTAAVRRIRTAGKQIAFVAIAGLVLGAGCGGGDSPTGPKGDTIGGTYSLQTVDDERLPAPIHHGPWLDGTANPVRFYNLFDCKVTNGVIELDEDDETFYLEVDMAYVADGRPGNRTIQVSGTYVVDDDAIYFTATNGVGASGVIEDGVIYLDVDALGTDRYREFIFALR